jgi:hypothetical protein
MLYMLHGVMGHIRGRGGDTRLDAEMYRGCESWLGRGVTIEI